MQCPPSGCQNRTMHHQHTISQIKNIGPLYFHSDPVNVWFPGFLCSGLSCCCDFPMASWKLHTSSKLKTGLRYARRRTQRCRSVPVKLGTERIINAGYFLIQIKFGLSVQPRKQSCNTSGKSPFPGNIVLFNSFQNTQFVYHASWNEAVQK